MANHAKCSASKAERWINCPGSIALEDMCPPEKPSGYAAEGTLAHSLGEMKLRLANDEISKAKYNAARRKIMQDPLFDGEMDEATDFYRDAVLEALNGAGSDAELSLEQRFRLDDWVPDGFGTSDAVVVNNDTITVIDLKYGKGVEVDAVNNPQLRLYALGASALFGSLYEFTKVKTMIIQPRLDHISVEEMALADLMDWAETVVKPKAKAAMEGTDEIACGEWCRFCPAKAICRERAEYNLELAKYDFAEGPLLSDDEVADVLARIDGLTRWASDIAAYALEQALAGKSYDGWKVVEGRSVRKYADQDKVVEALTSAGWDEALLFERKLNGLTAMEKLVGKKKLAEILGDLIVKPAGKPVLVPVTDKREAINTAAEAAKDFEEE